MLLAQISDLHIKPPGKLAYRRVDTAGALSRCIGRLNALVPRPDALLITGDLVDFGTVEEYEHLRRLLEPLALPYYLMMGNHDGRDALREVFADHAYLQEGFFVQYAIRLGPLRIVALDSQDPPHGGGRLCTVRRDWLAATLAAEPGTPTLVALHHPPFACGIEHMDYQALDAGDARELARIIAQHPQVERVLCGHVHREIHARFAGTLASTCPSPAHQVALDLAPRGPSAFVLEPPAFHLHCYASAGEAGDDGNLGAQGEPGNHGTAGILVTHLAYVDDFGPSHPFYDEHGALID
jgi:3',5'-cyclic AMP phosphodiesterase CpdA